MDIIENQNNKITLSVRFEPTLHAAIGQLAEEEDRPSFTNMVERLLKTHPRVQKLLVEPKVEIAVSK